MLNGRLSQAIRSIGVAELVAIAMPAPASAQSFLEMLFGGGRPAPRSVPSGTSAFADPLGLFGGGETRRPAAPSIGGGGGGQAYCVRTCDGRFFPLQRHGSISPGELCKSFCPAAKTAVFSGGQIDHATAPGLGRYSDMDNAFLYRTKVVDGCTCNGKDAFGLARVDIAEDPTLKPGDIVARTEGLATYRGKSGNVAQFTPISGSAGEWARRLAAVQVTAVAPVEKVERVADEPASRTRRRAVQLNR